MTQASAVIIVIVFAISIALPVLLRPMLAQLGVVDVPNERSSHDAPAIRGVGIAPMLAVFGGGLSVLAVAGLVAPWTTLLACLSTAVVAASLGLVEDVRGIPTRSRVVLQAAVGFGGAVVITAIAGVGPIWITLGTLVIVAYINAANFMDGVDGMSGMHGAVVGAVYAVIGALTGTEWLVLGGAMVAAAFLGFLPWNVLRGRMFLGDVGSYLLGASIAAIAFAAFLEGVSPITLAAPVVLYLTDTGTTLGRRMRAGEPWLEAHRTHVYQRLTDRGFSHLQVATVVALGSLFAGLAGLLSISGSVPGTATSVVLIVLIATAYARSGRVDPEVPGARESGS